MAGWFWAWILPHGIPEITAIVIAGAAGFVIARALVAPKGLSRRAALKREGRPRCSCCWAPWRCSCSAGFIEGTISQIHPPRLSVAFKMSFALVVGSGVYAYLWSGVARRLLSESAPSALKHGARRSPHRCRASRDDADRAPARGRAASPLDALI